MSVPFFFSENCACRLRDRIRTLDLWIFALVRCPVLFSSFLIHHNLNMILADCIVLECDLAWICDNQARIAVLYQVSYDSRIWASSSPHAWSVLQDPISDELAIWIEEHHADMVTLYLVILHQEVFFALDDEDALSLLRVANEVVHDLRNAWILAAKCHTCLDVTIDFVRNYLAGAPLDDENSLLEVALNYVRIGEGFICRHPCELKVIRLRYGICIYGAIITSIHKPLLVSDLPFLAAAIHQIVRAGLHLRELVAIFFVVSADMRFSPLAQLYSGLPIGVNHIATNVGVDLRPLDY